jgi:hypothetical protein
MTNLPANPDNSGVFGEDFSENRDQNPSNGDAGASG